MPDLHRNTQVRILASQKTGHVVPCLGVARALGVEPDIRHVAPRRLYRALAPFAPPDPIDGPRSPDSPLAEPFPDIVIASARETIAYARALKKASGGRIFSMFLGDPRFFRSSFDLIWAPEHDRLAGANVVTTLTAPHPHSAAARAKLRASPNPRLALLPAPRVAMLIGGPNSRFKFETGDCQRLVDAAGQIIGQGASLMVSPSRRTPERLTKAVMQKIDSAMKASPPHAFVWTQGANPYAHMLADADAFLITADSVNMIGEALSTGKPVHVFQLSGDAGKFARYFDALLAAGAIRPWRGQLETWSYAPIDATADIAAIVAERYAAFRAKKNTEVL